MVQEEASEDFQVTCMSNLPLAAGHLPIFEHSAK